MLMSVPTPANYLPPRLFRSIHGPSTLSRSLDLGPASLTSAVHHYPIIPYVPGDGVVHLFWPVATQLQDANL
jgi:hypothetical protein